MVAPWRGSSRGALGVEDVYKGRVTLIDEVVAIKFLAGSSRSRATIGGSSCSGEWHGKFLREVQMQAQVSSQSLVKLIAVCPARFAFIYPWADFGSWEDWLRRPGAWTAMQALNIMSGVAGGLKELHSHGFAHGGLRPARVLLFAADGAGGLVARVACVGDAMAAGGAQESSQVPHPEDIAVLNEKSIPYMDPRRLRGAPPDQSADVFAVGALLVEALLGRPVSIPAQAEQGDATHTRRPRPKQVWAQYLQALEEARQPGAAGWPGDLRTFVEEALSIVGSKMPSDEVACENVDVALEAEPLWDPEVLRDVATLAVELLQAGPEGSEHAARGMRPAAPSLRGPSSRPSMREVQQRLQAALASQEAGDEARRAAEQDAAAAAAAAAAQGEATRDRVCVICMDAQVQVRLRPCKHAALCQDCAAICVARGEPCPICRQTAQGFDLGQFLRTFAG